MPNKYIKGDITRLGKAHAKVQRAYDCICDALTIIDDCNVLRSGEFQKTAELPGKCNFAMKEIQKEIESLKNIV